MQDDSKETNEIFDDQEEYEEIVEIDEEGNVYKPNRAPRSSEKKPTILRDPEGEYKKYNNVINNEPNSDKQEIDISRD